MQVVKRSGKTATVDVSKITERIRKICREIPDADAIDVPALVSAVCAGMFTGMTTAALDAATAQAAEPLAVEHPAYGVLAARIAASNYRKTVIYRLWTNFLWSEPDLTLAEVQARYFEFVQRALVENVNEIGEVSPVINSRIYVRIAEHEFDYARNTYDCAGLALLQCTYLLQCSLRDAAGDIIRVPVEDPQHMIMRVALGIWAEDLGEDSYVRGELAPGELAAVRGCYDLMSRMMFTHATPTLFNAGTRREQMSSCFLTQIPEDSITGLAEWWADCAQISKYAGGVASAVHTVRSAHSYISGTNGHSGGLVPWLRVANVISEAVDQGGDKRPGTHAVYLEPWHADIYEYLELRKPRGAEQERARNLFYALWIPDEFMRRVKANEDWYLMCPHACPGLHTTHGEEHAELYRSYIAAGKYKRVVPARELWRHILPLLTELGQPYILFKDNINRKSNHRHLGTIQSSNLCCEICEYSAPDETAVCNLASICLPKFLMDTRTSGSGGAGSTDPDPYPNPDDASPETVSRLLARFDFVLFERVVRTCITNLDKIIDRNFYPTERARRSNMRHRPIGLGVQGLADMFSLLGLPFNCAAANAVQFRVFEAMYYYAVRTSCELAQLHGRYSTFAGSPASQGLLQPDLWLEEGHAPKFPLHQDWAHLRGLVRAHGLRNSLLTANMPTASTSTIMGMSPCFEPHSALVYKRNDRSGEHTKICEIFQRDMIARGLWSRRVYDAILGSRVGGIRDCTWLPAEIRAVYRCAYEIPPSDIVHAAIVRGPFVDQSQSMNLFLEEWGGGVAINSAYMRGWEEGIKTGSYYTRILPPADAQKIQRAAATAAAPVSKSTAADANPDENSGDSCPIGCDSCGA